MPFIILVLVHQDKSTIRLNNIKYISHKSNIINLIIYWQN